MINQISDQEFAQLRELINKESGISLNRLKREILVSRLSKRLRELQFQNFEEYYQMVLSDSGELTNLIDVISTNITHFFREPAQFDYLTSTVIPELLDRDPEKIRVWSAGCSTGEEPYSIAICALESLISHQAKVDLKILASDISTRVLKKAQEGIYRSEDLAAINPVILGRYFLTGVGRDRGLHRVKDDLKSALILKRINLNEAPYPIKGEFDVIFCRNVIIYFDKEIQSKVIDSLLRFLKPGGYLFCGHSESMIGLKEDLRAVYPCVYRKTESGAEKKMRAAC